MTLPWATGPLHAAQRTFRLLTGRLRSPARTSRAVISHHSRYLRAGRAPQGAAQNPGAINHQRRVRLSRIVVYFL